MMECYYCKKLFDHQQNITDLNILTCYHKCLNHQGISVLHVYTQKGSETCLRNVSIQYIFNGAHYAAFIPIPNSGVASLAGVDIGTLEIDFYDKDYFFHGSFYRGPIPEDFTPEQFPQFIKSLLKLKAFL